METTSLGIKVNFVLNDTGEELGRRKQTSERVGGREGKMNGWLAG